MAAGGPGQLAAHHFCVCREQITKKRCFRPCIAAFGSEASGMVYVACCGRPIMDLWKVLRGKN